MMETLQNADKTQLIAAAAIDRPAPATFRRPWIMVIVLTVLYAYSFLDRAIIALLVEPIEASLHLTDTQMGILLGLAFAGLYALATLPVGYLVDRYNRRGLIGFSALIWAVMTLLCAFAAGYGQMFLGRAGIGMAEAVIGPASFSLIRDGVPERWRGVAFSIYSSSPLVGSATAFLGGGALLHAANLGAFAHWGALGSVEPWRIVMGLAGLFGLPLCLLLLFVREPGRGPTDPVLGLGTSRQAMAHLWQNIGAFAPLLGYVTFGAIIAFGQGSWLATVLARKWALAPDHAGQLVGALTIPSGILGLVLTGFLLRRMAASRRDIHGYGALAALASGIGLAGAVFSPNLPLALALTAFGQFFFGVSFPVAATTLSQLVPARLMGRISAGYLLFQTLMGQTLGALLVALAAAHLFTGPERLPDGFGVTMGALGVASAVCALILRSVLKRRAV